MKIFYSIMLAVASLGFVACDDDDNTNGSSLPSGATPSADFTFTTLDDEQYAADAIKIINDDAKSADFTSIELFGDGHYLISGVGGAQKAMAHRLRRGALTRDAIYYGNGFEYGEYTKAGSVYTLARGQKLNVALLASEKVTYTNVNGATSTVSVTSAPTVVNADEKTLCRAWSNLNSEIWCYVNNIYAAHWKHVWENGAVKKEFHALPGLGFSEDDFNDDDDDLRRVVFTGFGTYICFYADGDVDLGHWSWSNRKDGEIAYYWLDDGESGNFTVRFKGKQMRVYEDQVETEDGNTVRVHGVSTFTSGY